MTSISLATFPSLKPEYRDLLPPDWQPTRELRVGRLWTLLEDAIDDCEAFEQLIKEYPGQFSWDMDCWLVEFADGCIVCMAGACLLRRRRGDPPITKDWMNAINSMRIGQFSIAYSQLYDTTVVTSVEQKLHPVYNLFLELQVSSEKVPSEYLTWDGYREIVALLRENDL